MALVEWVFELEEKIYTLIKTRSEKRLKSKYPNISFTTSDKASGKGTSYPIVYLHSVNGFEAGKDLEGKDINGVYFSMMVEVFSNNSKEDCSKVSAVIVDEFKEMSFSIGTLPEQNNIGNVYRKVFTANRYIGQADTLH